MFFVRIVSRHVPLWLGVNLDLLETNRIESRFRGNEISADHLLRTHELIRAGMSHALAAETAGDHNPVESCFGRRPSRFIAHGLIWPQNFVAILIPDNHQSL